MDEPRTLTMVGLGRRVATLDALYLNADRRLVELHALSFAADPDSWRRAYGRWEAARREYEQCRDTPYRIEGE